MLELDDQTTLNAMTLDSQSLAPRERSLVNFSLKMAPYLAWLAERVSWESSPRVGRSSGP